MNDDQLQLVARHDRQGPRYTSYPAANHFSAGFRHEDLDAAARETASRPLSVYVHLPFCSSPCFFCGCNRFISRLPGVAEQYLQRLEKEIRQRAPLFAGRPPIRQLHLGGGTPTFFSLAQLTHLIEVLDGTLRLNPAQDREFSIEVDPRSLRSGMLEGLAALGFNRVSIGVQDFDRAVQEAINRLQTFEQTRDAVTLARASGFASVSLDLIYGLPRQTAASFARTLALSLDLRPDRFSIYSYAHLPAMFKAQRQIAAEELPSPAEKLRIMGTSVRALLDAGYEYIGMDHFALPRDELARSRADNTLHRNFQGYSTHGGSDLLGVGVSAISQIGDCYSQNTKVLDDYYARIDSGQSAVVRGHHLSREDRLRKDVIDSIMCSGAVDARAIEARHHVSFQDHFAPALADLEPLRADGLIEADDRGVRAAPLGRYLLRAIAMPFDQYLSRPGSTGPAQYSRAI